MSAVFSSVRARLLALVLVAAVPVLVIAGSDAVLRHQHHLDQVATLAMARRETDAARYAAVLDDLQQLVLRLAAFMDVARLTSEECAGTLRRLRGMFEDRYSNLWLLDARGRMICDSEGTPPGTALDDAPAFRRSVAVQDYALGEFSRGPISQRLVLPAASPVRAQGEVVGFVGGAILLDWFRESVHRRSGESRHVTWLLDSAGTLSGLHGQPPGAQPAAALIDQLRSSPAAQTRLGASAQGADYAYSISAPDFGMRVLVGVPAAEARHEAQRVLLARFLELALFLVVCLFIVLYGAEVACTRPLRRLAAQVRAWTPGTAFAAPRSQWDPDEVISLGQAVTGAAETIGRREAELTHALRQRDLLLAEIHHRVKNNLQIVASLLSMQGERIEDAKLRAEFETARERVQALATLHRHLYMQGDIAAVAVVPLLHELVAQFAAAPEVEIAADPVILPAEQATSFALLVAEALAIPARHAARAGRLAVGLAERDGRTTLEISGDGVGLPSAGGDDHGMSLALMRGFAAHLGGEVELDDNRLRLTFPTPAR